MVQRFGVIRVGSFVIGLVAGLTLSMGAPAGAATTPTYTSQSFAMTVHVGPGQATACHVVGELFLPVGATAAHPVPAILTTNGFGGSYSDQVPLAEYFAGTEGYAVLAYSGLGFGGSGCNIELDSPAWDGQAASQLVSYLGRLPQVIKDGPDDPRVGMIGDSYGGAVQFAAASVDHRIDAIVPQITWNDLAYSLAPNNAGDVQRTDAVPGVLKDEWIAYFFADGEETPIKEYQATPFPPSTCPGYDPAVCPDLASSAAAGYPTAGTTSLLRAASMTTYHSTVHVPTLLMQGEADTLFNIDEAVANAEELRAQGSPVKLVLQSWGHSNDLAYAPGELSYSAGNHDYETTLIDDWFAHYLRHENVSTGPPVEFFRPWIHYTGSAEPAYGTAQALPVGQNATLYLSGSQDLVTSPSAVTAGSQTFLNPAAPASYSETSVVQFTSPFSNIPPTDGPGTFASWQTPVLTHDVDSIGVPTLRFTLTAPVASATTAAGPASYPVVYTKLYAVAPDGSKTLADRLVAPVRISDPGTPVTVTLPSEVQHFPAGDRIQLVIAASDEAYIGNRFPQPYTISTTVADPPILTLPEATADQENAGQRASATLPVAPKKSAKQTRQARRSAPNGTAAAAGQLANTGGTPALPLTAVVLLMTAAGAQRLRRRARRG